MGDTYKSEIYKNVYKSLSEISENFEAKELSVSEEVTLNLQEVDLVLSALGSSVDTIYAYELRPPEKLRVLEAKFRAVRERLFDEYTLKIKK